MFGTNLMVRIYLPLGSKTIIKMVRIYLSHIGINWRYSFATQSCASNLLGLILSMKFFCSSKKKKKRTRCQDLLDWTYTQSQASFTTKKRTCIRGFQIHRKYENLKFHAFSNKTALTSAGILHGTYYPLSPTFSCIDQSFFCLWHFLSYFLVLDLFSRLGSSIRGDFELSWWPAN